MTEIGRIILPEALSCLHSFITLKNIQDDQDTELNFSNDDINQATLCKTFKVHSSDLQFRSGVKTSLMKSEKLKKQTEAGKVVMNIERSFIDMNIEKAKNINEVDDMMNIKYKHRDDLRKFIIQTRKSNKALEESKIGRDEIITTVRDGKIRALLSNVKTNYGNTFDVARLEEDMYLKFSLEPLLNTLFRNKDDVSIFLKRHPFSGLARLADELTSFMVPDECVFRHLNFPFGSSRMASSAYQKWPIRNSAFNDTASIKQTGRLPYLKFENKLRTFRPQGL
ncbi:hypothetical protein INT48_004957 [Thamnidium elegans]|uniref:Uncharacterized protein n=1 Tax=Thamnidium elegans TaxID=101142 RepID=A0A8H7SVU7_9FUNG|nr:hypothetical protein INT48_004957 [Thamnidium elegans]